MTKESTHRLERTVSISLRWGIAVSGICMIVGLILAGTAGKLSGESVPLRQFIELLFWWDASSDAMTPGFVLAYIGAIILAATPLLRVITSVIGFHRERDVRFTAVSAVVLVLLAVEVLFILLA